MLALAVMPVVFVLGELISLGDLIFKLRRVNWLSLRIGFSSSESATVTEFLGNLKKVERGKPSS